MKNEQNKYKARICLIGTDNQIVQRKIIYVDQNYQRDLTDIIVKFGMEAARLTKLSRRLEGQKFFVHIEIPESDAIEDEVNRWVAAITSSRCQNW